MSRAVLRPVVLAILMACAFSLSAQVIKSSYLDLPLQGQWQSADSFTPSQYGSELYYDAATATIVQIRALPNMQKVGDITKFFQRRDAVSATPSQILSETIFPLPHGYTQKASQDISKGTKPPRVCDLKEAEGNPMWFYAGQLFDEYQMKSGGTASEVVEEYYPTRVLVAENRTIKGGDALVLETTTERSATDGVLKRMKMPAALKDQKIRFGWVQFAPGGVAAGQGVLSIAFATPANSPVSTDELLRQLASAQLKPMD